MYPKAIEVIPVRFSGEVTRLRFDYSQNGGTHFIEVDAPAGIEITHLEEIARRYNAVPSRETEHPLTIPRPWRVLIRFPSLSGTGEAIWGTYDTKEEAEEAANKIKAQDGTPVKFRLEEVC
jgi:hypothetical protein